MGSQNVVTYEQERIKIMTDEMMEIYKDKNLMNIIKFLRAGPKTINDLIEDFDKIGECKSDKSIYRYLKVLIESDLVAKAGKRIKSVTAGELQSETIYVRTAKIFISGNLKQKLSKSGDENIDLFNDVLGALLKTKFEKTFESYDNIIDLITELDLKKNKIIVEMFEKANQETLDNISQLDWGLIDYLIQYMGWLALSLEMDIAKELEECCAK